MHHVIAILLATLPLGWAVRVQANGTSYVFHAQEIRKHFKLVLLHSIDSYAILMPWEDQN